MNSDKAVGIFHVCLERLALHYGMVDMGRLASIGSDQAYSRGIKDFIDFTGVFARTAQGPEKNALGQFLTAAQKRFAKFT